MRKVGRGKEIKREKKNRNLKEETNPNEDMKSEGKEKEEYECKKERREKGRIERFKKRKK